MNHTTEMTIIIPAYNEKGNISKITEKLHELLENEFGFEILFVDDGSKDGTWQEICMAGEKYPFVRGIKFSRNFGKEAAIFAGLSGAKGECAVIIDSDLQHPPEKIKEMYTLWKEGYNIVECVKASRGKENAAYGAFAGIFNSIMSKLIKIDMSNCSDFKLLDRKAIDALLSMPEKNMFFRGLSSWIGFKTCKIEFEVGKREEGVSKWSSKMLVKYALNNISLFSGMPLEIITVPGVISLILSVVFAIAAAVNAVTGNQAQLAVVLWILFLLFGITMVGMGIMGYYLSKMLDEIRGRPRFIIEDRINDKAD